ncbi:MAG: hypothetical protein J0G30_03035 [Actinomycetales bacterium]|nr:hypothetical protein [Actinomycetales bacterium]
MLLTAPTAPVAAPRARFRAWRRDRPFVGGVLAALAGLEMFFSGQLDLGNIHVQMGISGFQATLIPAMLVLMGALAIATPGQRLFYGILTLVIAVYSLVGVNLGGFFVGMLLAAAGGVAIVTWRPRAAGEARAADARAEGSAPPARESAAATAVAAAVTTAPGGHAPAQWIDTSHVRTAPRRAAPPRPATGARPRTHGKARP